MPGPGSDPGARPGRAAGPLPGARPDPELGAKIGACGPRARAVFAASSRVVHTPGTTPLDAVVADAADPAEAVNGPRVLLSHARSLAVPAFDAALDNPVGWVRHVEPRAVSLGAPGRLPRGATVRRAVSPEDRDALLHCHHVEDVAAFHADAIERAGTLARICARGTPVRLAESDPALAELLGAERPPLATVSVLLATRRPAFLAHAVANVARQHYPRLELVLGLHGPGFASRAVQAALAGFEHPVKVLSVDADRPLGAVLGAASAAASGVLLAKMDDDDIYGPEHLWDLVLAHEYSGAALVGKFPATVYLARTERTVRQRSVPSETWSRSITGGAMLIARAELARAGGWRAVPRHVDEALIEDVLQSDGHVYRTHDAGYVLVRHGDRHTWRRDDGEFLAMAEAIEPGWAPGLAGIGEVPPPLSDGARVAG